MDVKIMATPKNILRNGVDAQSGFTLIEVMVSMLIFSFAVLGLVGMQARAVQISTDAENRMRASLMADEIISLMWNNSTVSLPSATITTWQGRVTNAAVSGLPASCATCGGTVTVGSDTTTLLPMATITIIWQAPSASSPSQFITTLEMPPPK
jgi:type IV pilus assembly protein PilV